MRIGGKWPYTASCTSPASWNQHSADFYMITHSTRMLCLCGGGETVSLEIVEQDKRALKAKKED
jgi:hypothetical protein